MDLLLARGEQSWQRSSATERRGWCRSPSRSLTTSSTRRSTRSPRTSSDPHDLARVRDILARPQVTVLVDEWDEDWTRLAWLRMDGRATLLEPDARGTRRGSRAAARAISAIREHRLEERPVIRIEVERSAQLVSLARDERQCDRLRCRGADRPGDLPWLALGLRRPGSGAGRLRRRYRADDLRRAVRD